MMSSLVFDFSQVLVLVSILHFARSSFEKKMNGVCGSFRQRPPFVGPWQQIASEKPKTVFS